MNNFLFSLNATVPVFAVIVLGHFFKRIGLIDEHFASVANKFVFKACLPCLVFQDLADTNIRKNFDFKYVGFCFIATLTSILVVWFLAKKFMRDKSMVGAFDSGSIPKQCRYFRHSVYSEYLWNIGHGTTYDNRFSAALQYICSYYFDIGKQQ